MSEDIDSIILKRVSDSEGDKVVGLRLKVAFERETSRSRGRGERRKESTEHTICRGGRV